MAIKIPVQDRVSAYPGRVKLTPVTGQDNIYTMERADSPVIEGTPINKDLLDNKAYTLTKDVTLYVSTNGSDGDGDGSSSAPFKTIQKAVDALPKHLGGCIAEISIDWGVYSERVVVEGFTSGRLVLSKPGELAIVKGGVDIINSSFVETNIYQIERNTDSDKPLLVVQDGSNVLIGSDVILDGINAGIAGMRVERNSHVVTGDGVTLTCNNCTMAVLATWCSFVSLSELTGSGNIFGMYATQGAIVSYNIDTLSKDWSNHADSGGLVLTGSNSSDLSDATLDL